MSAGPDHATFDIEILSQRVISTLQASGTSLLAGRAINLDGLDVEIRRICDRTKPLEAAQRSRARKCLLAVRDEIDRVTALLHAREEAVQCPPTTC